MRSLALAPLFLMMASITLGACAPPESTVGRKPKSSKGKSEDKSSKPDGEDDKDARPALPETTYSFSACTGVYEKARECGTAEVPLDYAKPDGKKIEVFVARMGATGKSAKQVYMLQGGPGGGASDLIFLGELLLKQDTNLDIILVEHRGVNRSSALHCPNADKAGAARTTPDPGADATACVAEIKEKWGESIPAFSTSNAARDLAVTINSLRADKQKAFVYGVSYGTYWAHRFLQLSPTNIDGVILDSAVSPTSQFLNDFNTQYDPALKRIAALCSSNSSCAEAFPGDAFAGMADVIKFAGSSTCGTALQADRDALSSIITSMLQGSPTAQLVPSFLARFKRCSSADQTALNSLSNAMFGGGGEGGGEEPAGEAEPTFSTPLYNTVAFSELWSNPRPTRTTMESQIREHVVATNSMLDMVTIEPIWPQYKSDQYMRKFAKTSMAVLTMNGDLDVQTPIETAQDLEDGLTGDNKYFFMVPHANHGVIFQSEDGTEVPCGTQLMLEFMGEPESRPAGACVKKTLPPNLDGGANLVQAYYGTTSAWSVKAPAGTTRDAADDAPARPLRVVKRMPRIGAIDPFNTRRFR